jgi:hypothetical protein
MNKEFELHWNKRRKKHPDEPAYISLCYILEGSGEDSADIFEIFDEYMPRDSFYKTERETMVLYLIDIAQDLK